MTLLEVCVDTIRGAKAAIQGGASRIELCSALSEGGLTPSAGLMQEAAKLSVPCYAMIRPRSGLFHFSDADADIMRADIEMAKRAGLAGVVLGAQDTSGGLHTALLKDLARVAEGLDMSLHRVIDVVPDPFTALDQAIDIGFSRVLTSGGQPLAPDGTERIADLVERALGRISIMPGCGLTAENVAQVVDATSVTEVHAACRVPCAGERAFSDFDPADGRFETSADKVSRMVQALR